MGGWNNQAKSDLKERLQCEGRWSAFVQVRDKLKNEGLSPLDAREKALLSFPQIDSKAEAEPEPLPAPSKVVPPKSTASFPPVPLGQGMVRSGKAVSTATLPSPKRTAGPDYHYGRAPDFVVDDRPAVPSAPETILEADIIRWVFNNVEDLDVTKDQAPSTGAWGLLEACRSDITTKRFFYTQIWSKLLSGKNLDDESIAIQADTDRIVAQLDKIQQISRAAVKASEDWQRN